jgi:hypothetical protein
VKLVAKHITSSVAVSLGIALTAGMIRAQSDQPDIFHPHDVRVFKATACTKDRKPVEALYYIVASRSDMAAGKSSPSSQLMKDQVDLNWRQIAGRLTSEQVMDERFAESYHAILSQLVPRLQQAVEEKSGVSISVSEVNSRPMDPAKDKDAPACGPE